MNATTQPPPTDPWAPGVRAAEVPVAEGGEPNPFEESSNEFETQTALLRPNKADIAQHLYELFPPMFVQPYPDAWIELAYGDPATGGKPDEAKHFSAFDLAGAAEFAEEKNKAGSNVYVGVALRHGKTDSRAKGRANGANVLTASHSWAEFDKQGDDERIAALLKEKDLLTAMTVVTGTTPNLRAHLYFKLAGGATPAELKAANTALKTLLSSDDVQNPDRIMRLAGTISYPPPKKVERGYVAELVTLHVAANPRDYRADTLINLTASMANPFLEYSKSVASGGRRSDDDLRALLETSRVKGKWHNSMRDAIATMIGRRWPDGAVRLVCAQYCDGGADDPDLVPLIDGALKKWGNGDEGDATSSPSTKSSPGIPLDYYENFDMSVAKDWIIKGAIAKGETSSWIGPPGAAKSALLIDLMTSVASGTGWRGHPSKGRLGVVYFALERGELVKRRLMAHAMQFAEPPNLLIAVASQIIDLLNQKCVAMIVDTVHAAEVHYSCTVGVIVIDTYGKGIAAGGGDENSAKDQNITLANLRRVQELTGVHVAFVGHTGKDETKGARGSNAHMGDVDMMVQISVAEDIRTATITKINDGVEGVLTRFKVKSVTLGQDEDGDDITTAIVSDDRFDTEKESSRARLNKSQRRAMELLDRCVIEEGKPAPTTEYPRGVSVVPMARWQTACLKGGLSPAGTKESADKAFRRAVKDLVAMHRIGIWDELVWIAYE